MSATLGQKPGLFFERFLGGRPLQQTVALQGASPQKPFKKKRRFWDQGRGEGRGREMAKNWAGLGMENEQGGQRNWRNEARFFPAPGARFVDLANPLICL